jgi:pimeloyl-ACP methyl ester carboxylesterase
MDIAMQGRGARTIVAVHGIQGTRAVWHALANELSAHATFVLPNLRGRGRAMRGVTPADYRLEAFAEELAHVIDTVTRGAPYCLAGWSMGVSVTLAALPWLANRPDALVLMSGSPALRELRWFHAHDDTALHAEIVAREKRLGLSDAADHDAVAHTWQSIRDTDQRATLAAIDIPALVIHGAEDDESPVGHAHWLLDGMPHAHLEIIAGAGHGIPTTHTTEVAAAMRRFLFD